MSVRDDSLWALAAENLSLSDKLPAVDLHGLAIYEAESILESFLNEQFMSGEEAVKIISGIGTGKLAAAVEKILAEYKRHGLVEDYLRIKGGGVFIARLSSR
ncbi:MAG: Smr/MutS family protein [Candidatus Doudnabacteria bacterium]|nr:Smr/MutS family protein [Candidatus Doudnabacteria bacterium]